MTRTTRSFSEVEGSPAVAPSVFARREHLARRAGVRGDHQPDRAGRVDESPGRHEDRVDRDAVRPRLGGQRARELLGGPRHRGEVRRPLGRPADPPSDERDASASRSEPPRRCPRRMHRGGLVRPSSDAHRSSVSSTNVAWRTGTGVATTQVNAPVPSTTRMRPRSPRRTPRRLGRRRSRGRGPAGARRDERDLVEVAQARPSATVPASATAVVRAIACSSAPRYSIGISW